MWQETGGDNIFHLFLTHSFQLSRSVFTYWIYYLHSTWCCLWIKSYHPKSPISQFWGDGAQGETARGAPLCPKNSAEYEEFLSRGMHQVVYPENTFNHYDNGQRQWKVQALRVTVYSRDVASTELIWEQESSNLDGTTDTQPDQYNSS